MGVSNSANGKPKSKNSKLADKKKSEKPKSSEGATNSPKEKENKGKYEVFEQLKVWKALVKNQSRKKIKVLRNDNGKEYVNNIL